MKKFTLNALLLALFTFTNTPLQAQEPTIQWQGSYGGSGNDHAGSVQQLANGTGYVICGYGSSTDGNLSGNHGLSDGYIAVIDTQSGYPVTMHQRVLGGSNGEEIYSVIQTSDGGFIATGYSYSTDGDVSNNYGYTDAWVVKMDNELTIEWEKSYTGPNINGIGDSGYNIKQTTDGGYVICGLTGSATGNSTDWWIFKIDSTGNLQWQNAIGGGDLETAFEIHQTTDGGYIVGGHTQSGSGDVTGFHGSFDIWVVKLSSIGAIEWQKALGGSGGDQAENVIPTADGGYLVAGITDSTDGDVSESLGNGDLWVVKLDSDGTIEWEKSYGGTGMDWAYTSLQAPDGNYYIGGFTNSTNGDVTGLHGSSDFWLLKIDQEGELLWQKTYGGSSLEIIEDMYLCNDGSLVLVGWTMSSDGDVAYNHGNGDIWLVKLAPEILSTPQISKNTIGLYPNPNNGIFTISTDNLLEENASINVYSTLGQLVYSGKVTSATVSVPNLATGMYQVQLLSGKISYSQKLVIK
ncbi:T9SS type A sorting domain-containing protein [Flavobacterium subsaxonicum]|uniref:Secretion system C-terminal sorting domain-containing protein n=1 Tax=Flavobacterium subsaxonicum WB 4.1-42 = DSM 21790 TaxID=1121898 RepID=A0A0A2MK05_9FLAO|nr:T9SS type A sorting domain-containing protein [Flavobacterium subsaxonicum]KGO91808.1 hypothetical protein Q766_16365 [Flavobacterium subsaxonicum WB 4.1-42 = DSM 21790]